MGELQCARDVTDLSGPATVYNLNSPWFSAQFSIGTASDNKSIYSVSVGIGGAGASVSSCTAETITSPPSYFGLYPYAQTSTQTRTKVNGQSVLDEQLLLLCASRARYVQW
jgi:hypothetical protein